MRKDSAQLTPYFHLHRGTDRWINVFDGQKKIKAELIDELLDIFICFFFCSFLYIKICIVCTYINILFF